MYFLVFVAGVNVLLKQQQQQTFSTWFGLIYRNIIDFYTQILYLSNFLLSLQILHFDIDNHIICKYGQFCLFFPDFTLPFFLVLSS